MIKRTLYFGNPAYLSLSACQLVIRKTGKEVGEEVCAEEDAQNFSSKSAAKYVSKVASNEETITRPIEDIGVLVVDHPQITLTSALIAALLANNCAIITCNGRRMPMGLLLPLDGNTTQSERFKDQINASLPLRKQLWQQTIKQKIANQAMVLKRMTKAEVRCMEKWVNDVKSGDTDNLEGRAAAYYWKNLFVPEIEHFVRGREEAPPNNMLNYGYAILRAVVARALVSSGLLPTLGIHHHNRYNAYCLADDIMEPYRPYVDAHIREWMYDNDAPEELTTEIKAYLLQIPTLEVVVDGKRSPLMVAVSQTTASLYKCFSGELRKICYPQM